MSVHPEGTPSPWSMCADGAAAAAVVRAELRPAGEAACVRIVREVRCGDAVLAERVIWSRTLAPQAGAALLEVMQSLGPGLLLASEAAAVLPPHHADALLDKMVADELDERRIAEEEAAGEVERAALMARKTREIGVFFTGTKRSPVLEMRRGSRANFFDLGFGAEWERERFWDWLKWQTGRFEDIAADVATHRIVYLDQVRGSGERQINFGEIYAHQTTNVPEDRVAVFERMCVTTPAVTFRDLRTALDTNRIKGTAMAHALICQGRVQVDLDRYLFDPSPVHLLPAVRFEPRIRF